MTAIGTLVKCKEDMEIVNLNINFYKGTLYTALIQDKIVVIDRTHKNIELNNKLFNKHFKIK